MRRITALLTQWGANRQHGESLCFEACKGGYFSTVEEYALKVVGKMAQGGTPTPQSPVAIRRVAAGSRVVCEGSAVTVPCDLYEGDVWYPMSGMVVRQYSAVVLDGSADEIWSGAGPVFQVELPLLGKADEYQNRILCDRLAVASNHIALSATNRMSGYYDSADRYPTQNWLCVYYTGSLTDFRSWLSQNPLEVVYRLGEPLMERYSPQKMVAPSGTAMVAQEPLDLAADLSATMLVWRGMI